jgi:hypothetical protein
MIRPNGYPNRSLGELKSGELCVIRYSVIVIDEAWTRTHHSPEQGLYQRINDNRRGTRLAVRGVKCVHGLQEADAHDCEPGALKHT